MDEKLPAGTQTLARGLTALRRVAASPAGMSVLAVADDLGIHRTIASRLLATLSEFHMVARGTDGRYRGSSGLLTLAEGAYGALCDVAVPVIRELAEELGSTLSLLVEEHGEAVALSVVTAPSARYRLVFAAGSTHPLDRAAAGVMLSAMSPHVDGEREAVTEARERGWSRTFGEVEPDAHGVAVPISGARSHLNACINLITYRKDVADNAVPAMKRAADKIEELLRAL